MKKIISAVVMAGALSQMANAMGPMGDTTHRHFYKEQEWIWQTSQSRVNDGSTRQATIQSRSIHIWALPLASLPPLRPPSVASLPPIRPPAS